MNNLCTNLSRADSHSRAQTLFRLDDNSRYWQQRNGNVMLPKEEMFDIDEKNLHPASSKKKASYKAGSWL